MRLREDRGGITLHWKLERTLEKGARHRYALPPQVKVKTEPRALPAGSTHPEARTQAPSVHPEADRTASISSTDPSLSKQIE